MMLFLGGLLIGFIGRNDGSQSDNTGYKVAGDVSGHFQWAKQNVKRSFATLFRQRSFEEGCRLRHVWNAAITSQIWCSNGGSAYSLHLLLVFFLVSWWMAWAKPSKWNKTSHQTAGGIRKVSPTTRVGRGSLSHLVAPRFPDWAKSPEKSHFGWASLSVMLWWIRWIT